MKRFFVTCAVCLILIPSITLAETDRKDVWEAASFISVARIGLNHASIAPDVQTFVGPSYSFGDDTSIMIGFSMNLDVTPTKPAMISAFIGGNFAQYVGVGYAFDVTTRDIAYVDETTQEQTLRTLYKTRHSIIFGALTRNKDFK